MAWMRRRWAHPTQTMARSTGAVARAAPRAGTFHPDDGTCPRNDGTNPRRVATVPPRRWHERPARATRGDAQTCGIVCPSTISMRGCPFL
jgi:hypothetical protein